MENQTQSIQIQSVPNNNEEFVYIYELNEGNYYISSSSSLASVKSTLWVKKHGFLRLKEEVRVPIRAGVSFKTIIVIKTMELFGIDKVRGSGYSSIEFSAETLFYLNKYLDRMKNINDIHVLGQIYKDMNEIRHRIWRAQEVLGLSYRDIMSKYDEFANNEDFLNLDMSRRLTRTEKKRIFGDSNNVGYAPFKDEKRKKPKVK